ncbi:MAG: class I SAM-dependent methyltransferase [Anaerolineae bacterium]|nr:class I SAM-dependent methyltransferase [Anaerolineae bacterium]
MTDNAMEFQSLVEQTKPTPHHIERAEIIKSLIPDNQGGIGAEIGVYKGQLIRPILDIVSPQELHIIDPWYLLGKEWQWGEESRSTTQALLAILAAYEDEFVSKRLVLHVGSSLDLLSTFPDDYFDWVYLDTIHTYEHTLRELNLLKLKVKKEGVIIGDDWNPEPTQPQHDLYRAVTEFVEAENYELIYADTNNTQWAIRK